MRSRVTEVQPTWRGIRADRPAEKAHLQTNDEILSFAGVPISGFKQLTNLLQK